MEGLVLVSLLLALLLLTAAWRTVHQLKRKRLISGMVWTIQGSLYLALFMVILLVYSNLHTYQRLTHESLVADVYLRQLSNQKYQLSISYSEADEDQHYYVLQGDQWQLDARILKWKGWANLLGLDSYYQLDRLSGRYEDISLARKRAPSVVDLRQPPRGLDIWKLKQLLQGKLGFVDTLFGQGVYMPMVDGAHYRVTVGQSGLIVRPVNTIAKQRMSLTQ